MGKKKKADPYFPMFWFGQKRANKHLFFLGLVCTGIAPSTSALMKSRQRNFMQKMALSS